MGDRSGIEWTDATWNPIVGCSVTSSGCKNCYAMQMAARLERMGSDRYAGLTRPSKAGPVWTGALRQAPEATLLQPLRWRRPRRIFVNSMSDLFHKDVPDEWIDQVFGVMALAPQHIFQVLTKRAKRMRAYMTRPAQARVDGLSKAILALGRDCLIFGPEWPLHNVWLGVSVEDQPRADERIPHLRATPAAKRFLSCEPLLDDVKLDAVRCPHLCRPPHYRNRCQTDGGKPTGTFDALGNGAIDWVIAGGESGPSARPMNINWVRSLRDQCQAAGVPFFFKQWGEWTHEALAMRDCWPAADWHEWPAEASHLNMPAAAVRIGKKKAGAMFDGREWREMPT